VGRAAASAFPAGRTGPERSTGACGNDRSALALAPNMGHSAELRRRVVARRASGGSYSVWRAVALAGGLSLVTIPTVGLA
jgi:hypothetical protein